MVNISIYDIWSYVCITTLAHMMIYCLAGQINDVPNYLPSIYCLSEVSQ